MITERLYYFANICTTEAQIFMKFLTLAHMIAIDYHVNAYTINQSINQSIYFHSVSYNNTADKINHPSPGPSWESLSYHHESSFMPITF